MSAPEVVFGYIAAKTERIHVGSAIMNLSPRSTTRCATPSASPCSTTSPAAATSGAPAAAPAATRWPPSTSSTPSHQGRCGTRSSARSCACGSRGTTRSTASSSRCRTPHNILPKPYGKGHPPLWVGCGNPRHLHQGRRARHRRHRLQLRADLQPEGPHRRLQGGHRELHRAARPVHERQRDDDQRRRLPRRTASGPARSRMSPGRGYLNTMVNMYHDTMPPQKGARGLAAARRTPSPTRTSSTCSSRPATCCAARPTRCSSRSAVPGGRLRPARLRHPERGLRARRGPRDDRAVRHEGHPAVRHRPGALHHPLPRAGRAEVLTLQRPLPPSTTSRSRCFRRARCSRWRDHRADLGELGPDANWRLF